MNALAYSHPEYPGRRYRKTGDGWSIAGPDGVYSAAGQFTSGTLDRLLAAGTLTPLPHKSVLRPDRCCDKWPFCNCSPGSPR